MRCNSVRPEADLNSTQHAIFRHGHAVIEGDEKQG